MAVFLHSRPSYYNFRPLEILRGVTKTFLTKFSRANEHLSQFSASFQVNRGGSWSTPRAVALPFAVMVIAHVLADNLNIVNLKGAFNIWSQYHLKSPIEFCLWFSKVVGVTKETDSLVTPTKPAVTIKPEKARFSMGIGTSSILS